MKYPGLEVIPVTQWRNGRIIAWVLETHKGEFCTKIISFNALFWECRHIGAPIEVVDKYEATWPTMEKLQTYVNEHFAWDWYEGFPRLAGALGMPLEDLIALPFSRIRELIQGICRHSYRQAGIQDLPESITIETGRVERVRLIEKCCSKCGHRTVSESTWLPDPKDSWLKGLIIPRH